jgi:hypothetical protein
MGETTKSAKEVAEKTRKRFEEAEKSFQEMQEEIAPFIRRRQFTEHSTAGEWRDASEYERSDFFRDLRKVVRKLPPNHPSKSDSQKR